MANLQEVTYAQAGLSRDDVYSLLFTEMAKHPDGLDMQSLYKIVNTELAKNSKTLSEQGKTSLRNLVNKGAVLDGFIYPHVIGDEKWRLTNEGKKLVEQQGKQVENVFNTETEIDEKEISNSVKGTILEKYILGLLKEMHPYYSWFHQGLQKNNERGLDLIANRIGEKQSDYKTIGVQIKNHKETSAPTKEEWLKFLAGCFVRHIEEVIFITTGKLTSEQRREAGEAKITVIEGIDELNRIAKLYNYKTFDEYNSEDY